MACRRRIIFYSIRLVAFLHASSSCFLFIFQAQNSLIFVFLKRCWRCFTRFTSGDFFSGADFDTRRNLSLSGKICSQVRSKNRLANDRSGVSMVSVSFLKINRSPLSFPNPITADLPPLLDMNQLLPFPASPESCRNLVVNGDVSPACNTSLVTFWIFFSSSLIEDVLAFLSRQTFLTSSTRLGQRQLKVYNWAWPTIFAIWICMGPVSFMGLKPIYLCKDKETCSNFLKSASLQYAFKITTSIFKCSRQLHLIPSVFPPFLLSSCDGHERSFSTSSFSKKIIFSHVSLFMRETTLYTWPKSVSTYWLTYSCDLMMLHNALTSRGLCSKIVATWIQVLVDHYPAWPNQVQPSYLIRFRADPYSFPTEDYPHRMLLMARALSFVPPFAWPRFGFFTLLSETTRLMFQYLDPNGRGHRSCLVLLSLRLFWDRNIQTLVHIFYLITLPNYSFKRRIQISSYWERSFSPSVFKERILPPSSATENVVKRSKVLKTLRAICVVRSPIMAEELDFDFKSIISETFWQKFPVFIYDDHRYSILYLLCSLIYVTSESHSLAKSFPLVT